ncbi:Yip1 domain-containing protein [Balamuthia mandrillaris]
MSLANQSGRGSVIPPPDDIPLDDDEGGNPFAEGGGQGTRSGPVPNYGDGGGYADNYGLDDDDFNPYSEPTSSAPSLSVPQTSTAAARPHSTPELQFEEGYFEDEELGEASTSTTTTATKQGAAEEVTNYRFWNIEYYSGYFNVDTKEVGSRILRSFLPFSVRFFDSVENNPDLYGLFWVSTTLIFVMAAASNFSDWLEMRNEFHYDFRRVSVGAAVIYSYVVIVPILLWLVFRWLRVQLSLLQILCIYGYAMFVFIPAAAVCILPFEWLRWLTVGLAVGLSLVFLLMNFFPPIMANNLKRRVFGGFVVLGGMGLLHLALALTFKFYFFAYDD